MSLKATFAALTLGLWAATLSAQTTGEIEHAAIEAEAGAAALAQEIQNPLASLVSLPLQFNFNEGVGQYDRRMFNLNVQPVIPLATASSN